MVLIDSNTKTLVQGITGTQGRFHTKSMLEYGTNIVAGVTPKKGGQEVHGVPVYNTVKEANEEHGIEATIIFVPARFCLSAVTDAINAGIKVIVPITEGVPVHDSIKMINLAKKENCRIIGPNTPGMLVPGQAKLGIMPSDLCRPGPVGIITKSGTLSYEIANSVSNRGHGVRVYIGIGGDPVRGSSFIELLGLLEEDKGTEKIVLIGEIGGDEEELAAKYISENVSKPVYAYIAGKSAPEGKRMGHAGAIISGDSGTAIGKINALRKVGVTIAEDPWSIAEILE
ncbi:MAG: succinate--CoA ligase subunit alpha [Candidatus Hodarchaeales archaeon]